MRLARARAAAAIGGFVRDRRVNARLPMNQTVRHDVTPRVIKRQVFGGELWAQVVLQGVALNDFFRLLRSAIAGQRPLVAPGPDGPWGCPVPVEVASVAKGRVLMC